MHPLITDNKCLKSEEKNIYVTCSIIRKIPRKSSISIVKYLLSPIHNRENTRLLAYIIIIISDCSSNMTFAFS